MNRDLIKATKAYALGQVERHKANVSIYISQSVGIGEHSDIVDSVVAELHKMAEWEDIVQMINKHFLSEAD